MWDIILNVVGLVLLVGTFWLTARMLRQAQAEDRSYSGENDSGAGWNGVGI